ncbi:MAG: 50S ribosomal protein L4 [Candidatus Altiarchaeota archaeon]|nr:50S ribosomal protein L4 [Candidatus Altiarchaeota archaeon]
MAQKTKSIGKGKKEKPRVAKESKKTAKVLSLKGQPKADMELPSVFATDYRIDIIQRAVVAEQSQKRQSYATAEGAGMNSTAQYYGRRRDYYRMTINRGMSRLPRIKRPKGGLGEVRLVPHSKGGRRAHPPKTEKILAKKINKKEWNYALRSAIAATVDEELVTGTGRNHIYDGISLPLVIESGFEKLAKTKEIRDVFSDLKLTDDQERASSKKTRAGRGKARGRRTKTGKSVLVVLSRDCSAKKAAENLAGVDVVEVKDLSVDLLAPGGYPGRLTLWTEDSLKKLDELYAQK